MMKSKLFQNKEAYARRIKRQGPIWSGELELQWFRNSLFLHLALLCFVLSPTRSVGDGICVLLLRSAWRDGRSGLYLRVSPTRSVGVRFVYFY